MRVPLALTLATTLLFLLGPALFLGRMPRPQALGLEKLLASVSLLQSFRAAPERPVPDLWRQRLGTATADRLWRLQTRTWWLFWDGHANGPPFLALSTRGLSEASFRALAVPPVRVGDLAIFSPDPLSRQILRERLRPQVRPSAGLRQRCLPRLEREQAVFWRPAAVGVMLGPLAPFLKGVQEGCLSLALGPDGLTWSGEAASVEGLLLQAPPGPLEVGPPPEFRPSPTDPLLEVRGPSLERLLAGLLARDLIRQPLAERYGFGREQIALLRRTPFRLVLRPVAEGPFQASMELTVVVNGQEGPWKALLERVAKTLMKEGFELHSRLPPPPAKARPHSLPATPAAPGSSAREAAPAVPEPAATAPAPGAPAAAEAPAPASLAPAGLRPPAPGSASRQEGRTAWPTAFWTRPDGVVVGGWQRRPLAGRNEQITLFLGSKPGQATPPLATSLPAGGGMRLLARPRELALRSLLPPDLPEVVKRSGWLWVSAEPVPGLGRDAPLSWLQGRLVLRP